MPTDKGLPGNPFSTRRNAWNDGDAIEETVMEEGLSGDTLVASSVLALRDAVMALAHEQRTANLQTLYTTDALEYGPWRELDDDIRARLGHPREDNA